MASQHVVKINIPMAAALKRLLVRNECPLCSLTVEEHSEVTLTVTGQIVDCSNAR